MHRRVVTAAVLAAALLAASCGSDGDGDDGATGDTPTTAATTATSAASGGTASPTSAPGTLTTPTTSANRPGTPTTTPATTPTAARPNLAAAKVRVTEVAAFTEPVAITTRPNDPKPATLYVVERAGRIRAMQPDGTVSPTAVLDLTSRTRAGGERGLLGLAFSPDGRYAYVNYTNTDGDTVVDEFTMAVDGRADATSRRTVLTQDQPYANHNGGHLAFGPDGYLYIGLGDGGSGNDPQRLTQRPDTFLGKMLRIDPRPANGQPYRVPDDNPFVGQAGTLPEIWMFGLRNPWRYSFDRATGDLWIGDVGQNAIEEVDVARAADGTGKGLNYGWPAYEGSARNLRDVTVANPAPPVYEYAHDDRLGGCSVTGGVVYRGTKIPALTGAYLFADYCAGGVRAIDSTAPGDAVELANDPTSVVAFGEGADGEVYVVSLEGTVSRLDPA